MDMLLGGVTGMCACSAVIFPLILLVSKFVKLEQPHFFARLPERIKGAVTLLPMGLLFSFSSVWGVYYRALAHGESITTGHVIIVAVVYIPLWLASAYGTGSIEKDRSESEQMRERGYMAVGGIIGSIVGAVFGGLYFTPASDIFAPLAEIGRLLAGGR